MTSRHSMYRHANNRSDPPLSRDLMAVSRAKFTAKFLASGKRKKIKSFFRLTLAHMYIPFLLCHAYV